MSGDEGRPAHEIVAIDHAVNGYFVKWHLPVTLARYRTYVADLLARPDFRPGMWALHDVRGSGDHTSLDEVRATARASRADNVRRGTVRTVLLVDSDLGFGMARLYQGQVDTGDVERGVARSLEEARALLDLPPDYRLPFD